MPLWTYCDKSREPGKLADVSVCAYCSVPLTVLFHERRKAENHSEDYDDLVGSVCQTCGWWRVRRDVGYWNPRRTTFNFSYETYCSAGSLKNLDVTNLETPIEEVRSFLCARYESRLSMHPRLYEETVASVFRDQGYDAIVTAYSNDGGIDAILTKGNETVGVQARRYKNAIAVEQIREFAGALLLAGVPKGVFVTTSRFQSGAYSTSKNLETRGYTIELLDAERFYDALKLAQRPQYSSKEDFLVTHDISGIPKIAGARNLD